MTAEKELMKSIVKVLAKYPTLKDVPAGEWNRVEAIITQFKAEVLVKFLMDIDEVHSMHIRENAERCVSNYLNQLKD